MKLKNIILIIIIILTLPAIMYGQMKISGIVVNNENESLIGVSIKIKETNKGTITDLDGKFNITVDKGHTLLFSYIGYQNSEMIVNTAKEMKVVLYESTKSLDEVVVVGYSEVKHKDLTGSVGVANMTDISKASVANFDEALAGRIAGVQVSSNEGMPGGEMNIVIRGNNSITQSNSPLYVVDGFPIEDQVANSINPNDIESISILKDASATAIYGARGANGVVIITSKKGVVGKTRVAFDASVGFFDIIKKIELMDSYEFVKLQSEIYSLVDFQARYLKDGLTIEDYKNMKSIDWQDQILQTAPVQNYSLNVSGGNLQTRYNGTFSVYDQDGVIKNSNYSRFQGRLSLDQKVTDKIKLNINVNYARMTQTGDSPSQTNYSGSANLLPNTWSYRPFANFDGYDILDNLTDDAVNVSSDYRINPVYIVNEEYRKQFTNNLRSNVFFEYEIIKDLKLKVSGGWTTNNYRNEQFNGSKTRSGNPYRSEGVNASVQNRETLSWVNENILTYKNYFDKSNKHYFDVLLGQTMQGGGYSDFYQRVIQIPKEELGMDGMGEGTLQKITSNSADWRLMSYLSRINYIFSEKYYATATFRADGSSKFPTKNRWGYFPSFSLAWNIDKEEFMRNLNFLSTLKLRTSWGQTGNNRISEYAYYAQMQSLISREGQNYSTEYPFDNANSSGYVMTSPGNSGLKWETTTQLDAGLELGLLDDKIKLTADVYRKETDGLLLNTNLAPSFGFTLGTMNIGKVRNQGLELTLETKNIKTRDFSWTSNFNIAFNQNKVLSLAQNQESLVSIISYSNAYIAKLGQPMGMMYGYIYEGTYKYNDFNKMPDGTFTLKDDVADNGTDRAGIRPGDIRFRDMNGDRIVNNKDAAVIGRGTPIHVGGFSNTFKYKDFDLNIFLQWSYGNDILNANKLSFARGKSEKDYNRWMVYSDRWTPENPESDIPRVGGWGSGVYSSYEIEDGSFLRLKTLSLGYTLPKKIIKKLSARTIRFYASSQNLFTWSNYSGYDPEVSTKNTALTPGFDWSAYPRALSCTFGVNVVF